MAATGHMVVHSVVQLSVAQAVLWKVKSVAYDVVAQPLDCMRFSSSVPGHLKVHSVVEPMQLHWTMCSAAFAGYLVVTAHARCLRSNSSAVVIVQANEDLLFSMNDAFELTQYRNGKTCCSSSDQTQEASGSAKLLVHKHIFSGNV